MAPQQIEYLTTECPHGHRVRGDIGWLNRDVCCPHCGTEFTFTRPENSAVEVIAPSQSPGNTPASASVSDTSVMKILGNFAAGNSQDDGTVRHCIDCGASYPGFVTKCYNCDTPLSLPTPKTDADGPSTIMAPSADPAKSGDTTESGDAVDFQPANPLPFDDVAVRKVMRPRREIEFLQRSDSLATLLQQARATRHTRYIVCDQTLEEVLGLVHIEDIVLANEDNFTIELVMRPVEKILDTTPVSQTLLRLQKAGEPIGLIVDDLDTVIGLVTVKDVMLKLLKKE